MVEIYMGDRPIAGLLRTEIKAVVRVQFEKLKQQQQQHANQVECRTQLFEDFFWVLCERDHASAPDNWMPDDSVDPRIERHTALMYEYTQWLMSDPRYGSTFAREIVNACNASPNLEAHIGQWGAVADKLFAPMLEFFT